MRHKMYVFSTNDNNFIINEKNNMSENKVIAIFDNEVKAREVFRNLKKGTGFEGNTPNFFSPVDYTVQKCTDVI